MFHGGCGSFRPQRRSATRAALLCKYALNCLTARHRILATNLSRKEPMPEDMLPTILRPQLQHVYQTDAERG
jgi:hypothetical protein